MGLDIEWVRKRLDNVVPTLLDFGDVQSKSSEERVVETFGLSVRLRVVGRLGEILHPQEHTKQQEEFAHKLGPILRQQVVLYAIWNNPMVNEY